MKACLLGHAVSLTVSILFSLDIIAHIAVMGTTVKVIAKLLIVWKQHVRHPTSNIL